MEWFLGSVFGVKGHSQRHIVNSILFITPVRVEHHH